MAEWGVHVNHTTIMRWVLRYAPDYERRWNRRARRVRSSLRVDETYIQTQPRTGYLSRAVDKQRKTVESVFQTSRGIASAMAFFRKAVASCAPRWPRKIELDGHKHSDWALRRLRPDFGRHRTRAPDPRAAVNVRTRPVDLLVAEDAMGYGLVVSLSVPIPR